MLGSVDWLVDEEMPEAPGREVGEPPAFLAPEEQARLAGMRFPKRRVEWLHGRWTAKTLLSQCHPACCGLSLAEIVIANEPAGAPYACLSGGERLPGCLSISHRDRLAFCGFTIQPDLRIGVDVEKIEPRAASFIETFFTPAETEFILSCPGDAQAGMTTLVWSAKEAALKALRKGLRIDTRSVEIKGIGGKTREAWNRFDVITSMTGDCDWQGGWQSEGDYILTLALTRLPPTP